MKWQERVAANIVSCASLAFCALAVSGCGYHLAVSRVDSNPLATIAERAAESDYSVIWMDDRTLRITSGRLLGSILTLGPYRNGYDFRFEPGVAPEDGRGRGTLYCEAYIKCNSAFILFIPSSWASDHNLEEVFGWSGVEWSQVDSEAHWSWGEWIVYSLGMIISGFAQALPGSLGGLH